MIFVFGSNLAGIHGAGAALVAKQKYGAVQHIGYGLMGWSFAIPTKDSRIRTLPLHSVEGYVNHFLDFAKHSYPSAVTVAQGIDYEFHVTCIGCGLAGFKHEQIAPMFKEAPDNCSFDTLWKPWLGETTPAGTRRPYWGTF